MLVAAVKRYIECTKHRARGKRTARWTGDQYICVEESRVNDQAPPIWLEFAVQSTCAAGHLLAAFYALHNATPLMYIFYGWIPVQYTFDMYLFGWTRRHLLGMRAGHCCPLKDIRIVYGENLNGEKFEQIDI